MRCTECGEAMNEVWQQPLRAEFRGVGTVTLESADYWECPSCGDTVLPDSTAQALDRRRAAMLRALVDSLPFTASFVSAGEAARLLGITRQALHKNRGIRAGLVYSATLGRDTFYVRRSIEEYLKTGDGRYPLVTKYACDDSPQGREWICPPESANYATMRFDPPQTWTQEVDDSLSASGPDTVFRHQEETCHA